MVQVSEILPAEFRSDVRGILNDWRTAELAATHDPRDMISIDGPINLILILC